MKSVTKRSLSEKQISEMTMRAFGETVMIQNISELTDGYFNNSYLVEIKEKSNSEPVKTVLKVAPKADVKVLGYESDLMEIEVSVLKEYASMNIQVPKVLFYDDTCSVIDSKYFFMSYFEGKPLNKVKEKMSEKQYTKLSIALAKDLAKSKETIGICFGIPKISEKIFDDWYSCFKFMIFELLDDSEAIGQKLPLDLNKKMVEILLERYQEDLSEVTEPILVHKDIWDGNIFVDKDTYEYVGMIDCERAIYAEPLLEVVCGFLDENNEFMRNYYGKIELSLAEQNRVKLYKFYLFLLMLVECPYRQYENNGQEKWAKERLEDIIKELQ